MVSPNTSASPQVSCQGWPSQDSEGARPAGCWAVDGGVVQGGGKAACQEQGGFNGKFSACSGAPHFQRQVSRITKYLNVP